jgi:KipI family sensor histidine kinase inhibitor
VSVELGDEISLAVNTRVRALEHLVAACRVPGILETVPSFRALLVYYDPLVIGYAALCARLDALAADASPAALPPPRHVELPCCYDEVLALDLVAAAARLDLSPDELVKVHSGADYIVYFIGFTPGLPYLDLPERLTIPRLEIPRVRVPPNSVSIGGTQCCIYSVESPGGFWIIGRTPVPLYDPARPEPVLLHAGDRVRFRPIDRPEFEAISAAAQGGTYRPVIGGEAAP